MLAAFITGCVFFALSMIFSLLIFVGSFIKNVGVTAYGLANRIIFLLFPCGLFVVEAGIFRYAPEAWGVSVILIVLNAYLLVLQTFLSVNSAVFTSKSIYRLTKFLVWKKYSYEDVTGYVMKKSSGTVVSRFGQRKAITFDVNIYLSDHTAVSFSLRDPSDKKAAHIKRMLEERHCHRNGRL